MEPATPRPTTWKALAFGALLFAGVDVGVFRCGPYRWLAKPDSSAGWVVRRTLIEPTLRPDLPQPSIVVFGDSRMGEACIPELLQAGLGAPPAGVRMATVPGTSPRVWPFLFEHVPPPRGGFQIAVVGLSDYDDDIPGKSWSERELDLAFLGPLLGLGDAALVAADFTAAGARRDTWLCACSRIYAWRRDVQDLLLAPWSRYDAVRRHYWWLAGDRGYPGVDRSLAGVRWEGGEVAGLRPEDRAAAPALAALVQPGPSIDESAYRRKWLGRMADLTAAAGTALVFVRMPTQVLPRAHPRARATAVLDELARRPHVRVLDRDLFADLERPECFYDALHLNRRAAEWFTRRLAEALLAACGPQLGR
jgi:hypothetical protein